jgi:hypothetical protein
MNTQKVTSLTVLGLILATAFAPVANAQTRPGGDRVALLFARFDANKDGKLTKDEVPAPVWSRLSVADLNGDGAVTMDEVMEFRSGR